MYNYSKLLTSLRCKKILIIGGTGFVGKNICDMLLTFNETFNAEIELVLIGRKNISYRNIKCIYHDITAPLTINEHFDYIIHAASPVGAMAVSFVETIHTIVKGTENVLSFSIKNKCDKLLFISSGAVYGEQPLNIRNIHEDYLLPQGIIDSTSPYALGKRQAELHCLNASKNEEIHISIARCFAFSGKHLTLDRHYAIGNFVKNALDGKKIQVKGDGMAIRSYLDAEDLAFWLLTILLQAKNGEIYNVGSDQSITIKDLAYKIAVRFDDVQVKIENNNSETIRSNTYVPSIEKAKKNLGLNVITSLESSIEKMILFNREIYERTSR